jgi:hypothetical protein
MTLPLYSSLVGPDVEVETALEADEALVFEPGEEGADSSDTIHETVLIILYSTGGATIILIMTLWITTL